MDELDIQKLSEKNGYCSCSDLQELFVQKKKAQDLETRCNNFKSEVDFSHAVASDIPFLEDYKEAAADLQKAVTGYYVMLNSYMDRGKLIPMLHESDLLQQHFQRYVSSLEARRSIQQKKAVSVHCGTCKQQVDLIC